MKTTAVHHEGWYYVSPASAAQSPLIKWQTDAATLWATLHSQAIR